MYKTIICSLGVLLFCMNAFAFDADEVALLNEYNTKYEELLAKKTKWPAIKEQSLSQVSMASEGYDQAILKVQELENTIKLLKNDVETQEKHLDFLKQIETVSNRIKAKIKEEAVTAGYFSSTSQVNPDSLRVQITNLQVEIDELNSIITEKESEISTLESSTEYQTLIRQRGQLRRNLASVESSISSKNTLIQNLEFSINSLNSQIARSKELENRYKIEAIDIRTRQIPELQSNELNLKNRLAQKQTQVSNSKTQRDTLTEEIRNLNQRIERLEHQLAEDPENLNLQRRLNNRKEERREKRQARRQLNDQISTLEREVTTLERRVARLREDIKNLQQLALRKDRESGEEAIKQIRLNSDLEQAEASISTNRIEVAQLKSEEINLQAQMRQNQSQINDFVQTNIRPLENQIAELEAEKAEVTSKRNQLAAWLNRLQREDLNIAQAPELISAQETVVQEYKLSVSDSEAELEQANQSLEPLEQALKSAVSKYNEEVESLSTMQDDLKTLENRVKIKLSGERND